MGSTQGMNVCIIHGDGDKICGKQYIENVCKFIEENNSKDKLNEFHFVNKAGHQVMQEQTKQTNEIIGNFCNKVNG